MLSITHGNVLLIGLFALVLGLSSCKISPPVVDGLRVTKFGTSPEGNVALQVEVRIQNASSVGIWVRKLRTDIFMGGQSVGSAYTKDRLKIKANSNEFYSLNLETNINWLQFITTHAMSLLGGNKQIVFDFKGQGKAGVCVYGKKFSFEHSEAVDIPSGF